MSLVWRWIVAGCIALGLLGAVYAVHQRFFRETTVRIAVASLNGQDGQLLSSINDWLADNGRRLRLRLVETGSDAASLEQLRARKVHIASARADSTSGADIASMMVLYHEMAVLMAPEGSPVTGWRDLNRRPLGVTAGTSRNDPLLLALLKANGVDDSLMVEVAPEAVRSELQRRAILAAAFVAPVPGNNLRQLRRFGSLRDPRGALAVLEVADAETLASRDRRYSAMTIPAGVLRPNPPLPDEGTETLAVARHLMVRDAAAALMITRLSREMLEAMRALQTRHPLLGQAGAPDIAADAFVRVHKGPKALFNGEDRGVLDFALEWIYVIPLLFGALASLGVWLRRWLSPDRPGDAETLMAEALELRRTAAEAQSMQELQALRRRFEHLAGQFESRLKTLESGDAAGVLAAFDLCDRRIDSRRAELDSIVQRTGRPL